MNVDDLIATAQHRTQEVQVCARGDLVAAHAEAVQALALLTDGDEGSLAGTEIADAVQRVKDIEDEQEAATITFVLTSVSRKVWADLLASHPPSKEQRRAGFDNDPSTFQPAAVAACIQEPEVTEEKAARLAEVLPAGEWNKLWATTLRLNITEVPHPKLAAATELLRTSERSSTTSDLEGSPAGGSLAGSGKR